MSRNFGCIGRCTTSVFPAADVTRPGFLEPSPGRSAWDPWLPGVTRAASSGPRAPPPRVWIVATLASPAVRLGPNGYSHQPSVA